jgi:hypothetical protein
MKVVHSENAAPVVTNPRLRDALHSISRNELINLVEDLAIPQHFKYNTKNNRQIADHIFSGLSSFGYEVEFQGRFANVVALNPQAVSNSVVLVGAHYDSVPNCPGADDNASAVAAMMACARIVAEFAPQLPVCFVAFNCEEDGLAGSDDFVNNYLPESGLEIREAHIPEMVGFATDTPDSQSRPASLPIKIPSVGNFLGIMGNQNSRNFVDQVLSLGKSYLPELPVVGLKLYLGVEKLVPDLDV